VLGGGKPRYNGSSLDGEMNNEILLQEPKLIVILSVNNAGIWASMTLGYVQIQDKRINIHFCSFVSSQSRRIFCPESQNVILEDHKFGL
jgi:hypothetical protein